MFPTLSLLFRLQGRGLVIASLLAFFLVSLRINYLLHRCHIASIDRFGGETGRSELNVHPPPFLLLFLLLRAFEGPSGSGLNDGL